MNSHLKALQFAEVAMGKYFTYKTKSELENAIFTIHITTLNGISTMELSVQKDETSNRIKLRVKDQVEIITIPPEFNVKYSNTVLITPQRAVVIILLKSYQNKRNN